MTKMWTAMLSWPTWSLLVLQWMTCPHRLVRLQQNALQLFQTSFNSVSSLSFDNDLAKLLTTQYNALPLRYLLVARWRNRFLGNRRASVLRWRHWVATWQQLDDGFLVSRRQWESIKSLIDRLLAEAPCTAPCSPGYWLAGAPIAGAGEGRGYLQLAVDKACRRAQWYH